VGTGTVSRHFPTKEALFQVVFVDRVQRLADRARALAGAAARDRVIAIVSQGMLAPAARP
jgi:AcrR family transcriptional regulator